MAKKEPISPQAAARLEALRSDSWVALSEDESHIVAVGATHAEVSQNSERAGVADPTVDPSADG